MEIENENNTAVDDFEAAFDAAGETAVDDEVIEEVVETEATDEVIEEEVDDIPVVDERDQQIEELRARLDEAEKARVEQQRQILEKLVDNQAPKEPQEKTLQELLLEQFDDDTAPRLQKVVGQLATKKEVDDLNRKLEQLFHHQARNAISSADAKMENELRQGGRSDADVASITKIKNDLMEQGNNFRSVEAAYGAALFMFDRQNSKKTASKTKQARVDKTEKRAAATMPSNTGRTSGVPKLTKEEINNVAELSDGEFWEAVEKLGYNIEE